MASRSVSSVVRFAGIATLLLAVGGSENTAQAYPLNPWGTVTAEGAVAVTPYLYIYDTGQSWYPYLYGSYGVTEKVDVIAGVGLYAGGGFGLSSLELFGRYFLTDQVGLALHVLNVPGGETRVGPEVHFVLGNDKFTFTGNLGVRPIFAGGGMVGLEMGGYLAPEVTVSDRLSVFCEVNPLITRLPVDNGTDEMVNSTSITLVPGVGLSLDPEGVHTMAVGLQIPVPPSGVGSLSLGLWYSTSFGGE